MTLNATNVYILLELTREVLAGVHVSPELKCRRVRTIQSINCWGQVHLSYLAAEVRLSC